MMGQMVSFQPAQIALIKSTVARDTNTQEFNLFMEACKAYGLDPFRKQIHAVVYNKDDEKKRKMTIIVSRDGLRVMASRCGDYRPAEEPARITYDESIKGSSNPLGIVSAFVKLWKRGQSGEWYPVAGEAYWDEYAPMKEEWADDPVTGKRKPTGNKSLDTSGNWAKMPRVMIAKCAESQALRAGWPETFGGIYAEEEVEASMAAMSASEAIDEYQRQEREAKIGGKAVMFVFDDAGVLDRVPLGEVADRLASFVNQSDPLDVYKFNTRNTHGLREFWAYNAGDALEIKKMIEAKISQLPVASTE